MGCPKRITVSLLSFLGFLILFGFRTVITMIMIYVIKDNDNNRATLYKECTINGTAFDLHLDWSVATSQYFNTAYFIGQVISQLPGGILAARFSPTKLFGGAVFISGGCFWVLAFLMKYSPVVVFVSRFIQGLVEGVCQPAMSSVVSAWAPKSERTRIVGFSYSGIYLSTTVASVITGATTCYVSWNAGLFIYGGLGIMWSLFWLCTIYDSPTLHPSLDEKENRIFEEEGSHVQVASAAVAKNIPWTRIFTSAPVWALFLANFTRSWVLATMVTEIPQYFADVFRLNVASIGFLTAFPPVLMVVSIIFSGILFDKLIKTEKISVTFGRKLAISIGFGSEAVAILILGFVRSYPAACFLLIVGEGMAGIGSPGYKVNPVDLAPQYSSVLVGLVRLGLLGATISTAMAGALRQKNMESWRRILVITGSIHLFAVICFAIFGSGREQDWAKSGYTEIKIPEKENISTYGSTSETPQIKTDMNGIIYSNDSKSQNGHVTILNNSSQQSNSK
ncbi:vesicular glutamate transporter 3-like [Saccostrea echinata]|uniref:vesicular glutamate transporter 3-like n=1 Tax=Saccostrea echinata TaxID=191078 RepID=UPI002A7F7628|nr:vesicular glutamate transporter 3-like [Saccostrea echinata]